MYQEPIDRKRLWAWLAVAMCAPLAHFSGGSWLALLILGLICGSLLVLLPDCSAIPDSKILCLLELAWIMILLSQFMPLSAQYWPGEKSRLVTPAVLLGLGAYGCSKRASRVAGVLFWILVILFVPVLIVGSKDVNFKWLLPKSMDLSLWLIPILLLPGLSSFLPVSQKRGRSWYPGILIFGLILWLITAGVLSPAVAAQSETPFRELSRCLTIGAASRFESLIGVSVTLGWFALASLLIRCGSIFAQQLGIKEKWNHWIVAGSAVLLSWTDVQLSDTFGAVFSLILWILIPMLHRKIFSKKREKNA